MQTIKTISQHLEHMTYFADITIKKADCAFECIAEFSNGDKVIAVRYDIKSAIEALNNNMQWYVLNC